MPELFIPVTICAHLAAIPAVCSALVSPGDIEIGRSVVDARPFYHEIGNSPILIAAIEKTAAIPST